MECRTFDSNFYYMIGFSICVLSVLDFIAGCGSFFTLNLIIMSDPLANTQLELACRIGSLDDVLEALDDGADINCNGSEPLFIAIMANNRDLVSLLIEMGADVTMFEITSNDPTDVIELLMELAPSPEGEPTDETVDARRIRAFDKMIRNNGLAEPVIRGRWREYKTFRDGLKWIAAEECHDAVKEFLEMIEHVLPEIGEKGIVDFLNNGSAARVAELSERYTAAEEVPGELLKDYLKDRQQVA